MASVWCSDLRSPWADLVKRHLCQEPQTMFARVSSVQNGVIFAEVADFVPSEGLKLREPLHEIQIETTVACQFKLLDWIGMLGHISEDNMIRIPEGGSIWKISSGLPDLPWTYVHLFSGAFQGWSQALEWMQTKGLAQEARQVSIDNDPDIARIWNVQGYEIFHDAVEVDVSTDQMKIGISGSIEDTTWYNVLRDDANLWMTMSPPCQSWSGGESMSGLNNDNGIRFVQATEVVLNLRPMVITAECSDRITSHPHFKIVRFLLHKAGYKLAWTTVGDHSQLVGMARKRWLAVYLRHDIEPLRLGGNFKLAAECLSWSHESFDFFCPQVVEDQLILTPPLLDLYGNHEYLPKGMTKGKPKPTTPEQVLLCRLLQENETMPTLVASYSQQHLIPERNLSEKGIFASLTKTKEQWAFFNPIKFIGLLGSPSCAVNVIPKAIRIAFRQIGNSISVPHALMTIMVAKTAISQCNASINASVIECFADRLVADECQVFQIRDMLIICHESKVESLLTMVDPVRCPAPTVVVLIGETEHHVDDAMTIHDFFVTLGWESPQIEGFRCYDNQRSIAIRCALSELVPSHVHVSCRSATIAVLKLSRSQSAPLHETPSRHEEIQTISDHEEDQSETVGGDNRSQASENQTWICTSSELDCIEAEASRRPESIVSILHFPETQPTFMMCHIDNFEEEVKMQMQKKYGEVQVHVLSHVPSWSDVDLAVLVLHRPPPIDHACVVWVNQTKQELAVIEVPRSIRLQDFSPDATQATINAEVIDPARATVISNGDMIVTVHDTQAVTPRETLAISEGCKMANDEMAWLSLRMNEAQDHVFILQPLCIGHGNPAEAYQKVVIEPISMILQAQSNITKIMIPILESGHWSAVEITMDNISECKFIAGVSPSTEENMRTRIATIFR
eukprot:Skav205001  [mRNA]  locus=scaffold3521:100694:103414:- [translate_table: standard]